MAEQDCAEFRFAGFDAGACAFLAISALTSLPLVGLLGYPYWLYALAMVLVLAPGMRFTISVVPGGVCVTKKWLFVPYWKDRGSQIHGVWYSGDWGEPEGALGVVLDLDKSEVHVGSPRTMKFLFETLRPGTVNEAQRGVDS